MAVGSEASARPRRTKRRIALAQQALEISPDCAREDGFDEVSRNNAPEAESIRATVDALVAHDVPR